jgi:hypothetical protein
MRSFSTKWGSGTMGATAIQAASAIKIPKGTRSNHANIVCLS